MKRKLVKIVPRPYSRFHFGQMKMDHDLSLSDSDSFCRSDTLFSGLINSYSKVYDSADSFVEAFRDGKIIISSLFYFIEKAGEDAIFLLPKPSFLSLYIKKEADGSHKKLGKISFVSKKVWEQGLKITEWLDETKYKLIQNKIIVTAEEYKTYNFSEKDKIFELHSMPKSPIEGDKNASIFYETDVVLHSLENATIGLYFMYECDEVFEVELRNAINILAFSGFGGEISLIGRTIQIAPELGTEIEFMNGEKFSNLSLYNPNDAEEFKNCQFYETFLRGGRRKTQNNHTMVVRMIEEGALFTSSEIKGRMVNLGDHEINANPILRNGMPLLIPINI